MNTIPSSTHTSRPDLLRELETIFRFHSSVNHQTSSGRGRVELSSEEKDLLQKTAENNLTETEKEKVLPLLASNELAMEYLTSLARESP